MTAHTPGPWTVRPGVYDTNPETACEFPHGPEVIVNDETIAFCQLNGEADAQLIAAAPDLLAACRYIVDAADTGDEMVAVSLARRAIAKAEGRQ